MGCKFFLLFVLIITPKILFGGFCDPHPFDYDLSPRVTFGNEPRAMVCCHGMRGNFQIAKRVIEGEAYSGTIVSFNFPDFDLQKGESSANLPTLGTIDELLPLIFVLKNVAEDPSVKVIDLYGFSAGGGAIINTLATLNGSRFDGDLLKIGVTSSNKEKILEKIQKGVVVLDAPLKSIREIQAANGTSEKLDFIASRYKQNGMEPIDAIEGLRGLKLHILVHFQVPDEALSNRDDELFISRLQDVNKGGEVFLSRGEGGHAQPHPTLWDNFRTVIESK